MGEEKKPTLYEQAIAKMERERKVKDQLAAWEADFAHQDYYAWFLDQVEKEEAQS